MDSITWFYTTTAKQHELKLNVASWASVFLILCVSVLTTKAMWIITSKYEGEFGLPSLKLLLWKYFLTAVGNIMKSLCDVFFLINFILSLHFLFNEFRMFSVELVLDAFKSHQWLSHEFGFFSFTFPLSSCYSFMVKSFAYVSLHY